MPKTRYDRTTIPGWLDGLDKTKTHEVIVPSIADSSRLVDGVLYWFRQNRSVYVSNEDYLRVAPHLGDCWAVREDTPSPSFRHSRIAEWGGYLASAYYAITHVHTRGPVLAPI